MYYYWLLCCNIHVHCLQVEPTMFIQVQCILALSTQLGKVVGIIA